MSSKRTDRLNSLLREVISEVLQREVKNPDIHPMTSVSRVDITKDLRHAKVYVSILASDAQRAATLAALQRAAGFIAIRSSKKMVIRFFPELRFLLDDTVDKQMEIDSLIAKIQRERDARESP
jgi:ribosome-binding factor A